MRAPAPRYNSNDGVIDAATDALGGLVLESYDRVGEVCLTVDRARLVEAMTRLRDTPGLEYQQLMEIAGVDYPDRTERFEVVYCLLSLTRNHRLHVHVATDEDHPIPSVTDLWPVAGWLEREVYDMYGVLFAGNRDLRGLRLLRHDIPRLARVPGLPVHPGDAHSRGPRQSCARF